MSGGAAAPPFRLRAPGPGDGSALREPEPAVGASEDAPFPLAFPSRVR